MERKLEPVTFDLRNLPAEFYANPYPIYQRLRENSPVYCCPDESFFITRYELVHAIYRNPKQYCSDKKQQFTPVFGVESPLYQHHTTSLVFNDPPLHTRVRKAIGNALSTKTVVAMQPGLETLVEGLLDQIEDKASFDLIADFAAAIPIEIIGNLLRIPADEREPLRRWSLAILGALEVNLSAQEKAEGERCVTEMLEYLETFISRRRNQLTDADDDILARLLRWESGTDKLSSVELYHQCIFLLNAGHETTSNLIGNGVHLLVEEEAQLNLLKKRPDLINCAVEEILRFESSNQLGNRTCTQDAEINGIPIPKHSILTLCIGAANRDPQFFDNPDTFDITRSPNPHLAFGAGIHTCAGINVARLEGQVAISRIFSRFPKLKLNGQPKRSQRARFRGFEFVPMTIV